MVLGSHPTQAAPHRAGDQGMGGVELRAGSGPQGAVNQLCVGPVASCGFVLGRFSAKEPRCLESVSVGPWVVLWFLLEEPMILVSK